METRWTNVLKLSKFTAKMSIFKNIYKLLKQEFICICIL